MRTEFLKLNLWAINRIPTTKGMIWKVMEFLEIPSFVRWHIRPKTSYIFEDTEIKLTENDIEDCHHLDKPGNNTIVKFINGILF